MRSKVDDSESQRNADHIVTTMHSHGLQKFLGEHHHRLLSERSKKLSKTKVNSMRKWLLSGALDDSCAASEDVNLHEAVQLVEILFDTLPQIRLLRWEYSLTLEDQERRERMAGSKTQAVAADTTSSADLPAESGGGEHSSTTEQLSPNIETKPQTSQQDLEVDLGWNSEGFRTGSKTGQKGLMKDNDEQLALQTTVPRSLLTKALTPRIDLSAIPEGPSRASLHQSAHLPVASRLGRSSMAIGGNIPYGHNITGDKKLFVVDMNRQVAKPIPRASLEEQIGMYVHLNAYLVTNKV